jgi:hypothetical protein
MVYGQKARVIFTAAGALRMAVTVMNENFHAMPLLGIPNNLFR